MAWSVQDGRGWRPPASHSRPRPGPHAPKPKISLMLVPRMDVQEHPPLPFSSTAQKQYCTAQNQTHACAPTPSRPPQPADALRQAQFQLEEEWENDIAAMSASPGMSAFANPATAVNSVDRLLTMWVLQHEIVFLLSFSVSRASPGQGPPARAHMHGHGRQQQPPMAVCMEVIAWRVGSFPSAQCLLADRDHACVGHARAGTSTAGTPSGLPPRPGASPMCGIQASRRPGQVGALSRAREAQGPDQPLSSAQLHGLNPEASLCTGSQDPAAKLRLSLGLLHVPSQASPSMDLANAQPASWSVNAT